MGVRHLHYLDLSPELRKKAAQSARERMSNLVNMNPFLTQDQMIGVQAQLAQLSDWEHGTMAEGGAGAPLHLAAPPPPALPKAPEPPVASLLANANIIASAVVKAPEPEPTSEGDRETPIIDMSHLASLLKKPEPR